MASPCSLLGCVIIPLGQPSAGHQCFCVCSHLVTELCKASVMLTQRVTMTFRLRNLAKVT